MWQTTTILRGLKLGGQTFMSENSAKKLVVALPFLMIAFSNNGFLQRWRFMSVSSALEKHCWHGYLRQLFLSPTMSMRQDLILLGAPIHNYHINSLLEQASHAGAWRLCWGCLATQDDDTGGTRPILGDVVDDHYVKRPGGRIDSRMNYGMSYEHKTGHMMEKRNRQGPHPWVYCLSCSGFP